MLSLPSVRADEEFHVFGQFGLVLTGSGERVPSIAQGVE
jgi:hypothetical protein